MIILKSRDEIDRIRKANRIVAQVMAKLKESIRPGITTAEVDAIGEDLILKHGALPAFKGYQGYQHALCLAVNEEVVHGIPGKRELKDGDIMGIDCGVLIDGFYGDHAWTFPIGNVSETAKNLLAVTENALMNGIAAATIDHRLYDISAAIQEVAEAAGFSVVRDYVGHGIGRSLHEDPQIPNFGERGTGMRLRAGLVVALEPMVNEGSHDVELLSDGWTVVTKDRKLSAHMEHTVAITENGPEILSRL